MNLYTYNYNVALTCVICNDGQKLIMAMRLDRERKFSGCQLCKRFVTKERISKDSDENEEAIS